MIKKIINTEYIDKKQYKLVKVENLLFDEEIDINGFGHRLNKNSWALNCSDYLDTGLLLDELYDDQ